MVVFYLTRVQDIPYPPLHNHKILSIRRRPGEPQTQNPGPTCIRVPFNTTATLTVDIVCIRNQLLAIHIQCKQSIPIRITLRQI